MKSKFNILFYLTVFIFFLASSLSFATTYYVSTTGSNTNTGTTTKPWKSIAYAVGKMNAGDTTYVRGGIYKEGEIRFAKSGSSSAPIKLLNMTGQAPVIECSYTNTPYPRILIQNTTKNSKGSLNPMSYITIEGFEIRNCYNGIKFEHGNNLTIRKNSVHHSKGSGVYGNGTKILIDRNRIYSNARTVTTAPYGHGLYLNGTGITITNNLIYNNMAYGLQMRAIVLYDSKVHPSPDYALSKNWIVANNTFAYQTKGAGMVVWGSTCSGAQIVDNIFYENGSTNPSTSAQGINFISTTCTGISIKNNLSYASGAGALGFLGSGAKSGLHYTKSGNIEKVNPMFASAPATLPSSPNFGLTAKSPAINKGVNLTAASTKMSYNSLARPRGVYYDIGAYEY